MVRMLELGSGGRKEHSGLRERCEQKPGGKHKEWQKLKPNEGKALNVQSRRYRSDLGGMFLEPRMGILDLSSQELILTPCFSLSPWVPSAPIDLFFGSTQTRLEFSNRNSY